VAALCLLVACGGRSLLPAGDVRTDATPDPAADVREEFIPGRTEKWQLEQDDVGSSAIVNEQLVITLAAPNTVQYATLDGRVFGDFVLEVDTWQRAGPPESSYGILFRVQEDGQFYRFDITGNGLYMIERRGLDGSWTRLLPDWTPSPAIGQGLNVANRLKVIAAGPSLTFYANDVLLTQLTDDTLAAGGIALDAGTFGGANLQASFDNLTVTGGAP
jgi:hypothetical protein